MKRSILIGLVCAVGIPAAILAASAELKAQRRAEIDRYSTALVEQLKGQPQDTLSFEGAAIKALQAATAAHGKVVTAKSVGNEWSLKHDLWSATFEVRRHRAATLETYLMKRDRVWRVAIRVRRG